MQPALQSADISSVRPLPSAQLCLHCRTPLARGDVDYCCTGCRHVHELLESEGLDRYYALRGERTLAPVGPHTVQQDAPWLELLEAELGSGAGPRRLALDVQGVQCGACVWLIEALFRRQPGALRIDLNPALGRLSCLVDTSFAPRAFVATVEEFGYRLGPARKTTRPQSDGLLLRTGLCGALAINAMLLGAATYFGLSQGPLHELVQNASFALATLSALIGGSYFVERAWQGLRHGILHLDLPIAVGMGLAYAGSVWSLYFGGATASYLDTVSVFIALMLVGRLLQERLVEKNRRQLLESDGASGLLTRRVRAGRTELVTCPALVMGDHLLVCPGEIVPVRALLLDEHADCALDWINGESEPRRFTAGAELPAGAINAGKSALRAEALTLFERSELDLLLRDDDSARQRARGDFWDSLSRLYVVGVLVAAALGALLWVLRGGSATQVLEVTVAVLVVTCPCAFGIATPLAYELAVARLRKLGLFVRDGAFFDRAAGVRRIVFDKTGTVTTGALELRRPELLRALQAYPRSLLYNMCARSGHPKSAAIARALLAADPELKLRALTVVEEPGRGLEVVAGPTHYRLGDPSWATGKPSASKAPVFTANGVVLIELETREVLRPDAVREAAELAREGYELWLASGDETARVHEVASTIHVAAEQALGDLSPEGKRELVSRLDRSDTLMIGDGINDAPALSRARCSGTPAVDRPFVPARADFYFLTPGLHPVRAALHVARRVRRVVRTALWFAVAYNVLAVGLSYGGLMQPWLAALLMPASSLLVLTYTALALAPGRPSWKW
jgi:Cu2+-exporting ATPase